MTTSRTKALTLAMLMLASGLAILPPTTVTGQGGDTTTIPVSYEPVEGIDTIPLHFWRQNRDTSSCAPSGTQQLENALCAMRVNEPPSTNPPSPDSEVRNVTNSPNNPGEGNLVRFKLDTNPNTNDSRPAQYPFRIKAGTDVIRFSLHYDSDASCVMLGGQPSGQALDFHVRVGVTDPDASSITNPVATGMETACNTPSGGLRDPEGSQISVRMSLSQGVDVPRDQILMAEIWAAGSSQTTGPISGLQWSLLFEDGAFDSRMSIDTNQVVQRAMWATDKSGQHVESFNPNAPESERFMVGHVAFRSPFGAAAVPTGSNANPVTARLFYPDSSPVTFFEGTDDETEEVRMEEIQGLRDRDGARKVFRFASTNGDPAWHYEQGAQSGKYDLRVTSSILGDQRTVTREIGMGAFDFDLSLVDQESSLHQLRPSSSTTFLLELANEATFSDSYEITANPGQAWTVEIQGVDQNNRISLDAEETALIRVTLTPPSDASSGDAALVTVTARSLTSSAENTVNLQGTITDNVIRDVGILMLPEETYEVGIDRDTRITKVYAWNRGTATDSLQVSIVDGSLSPNDPDRFQVRLDQRTFDNVAPGDIVPIPIRVTTTDQVSGDDTFDFNVRVTSVAESTETVQDQVSTIVRAVKSFTVTALDHRNAQAQSSLRFGKFNLNDSETTTTGRVCTDDDRSEEYNNECREYTQHAYHRFMVRNTGDQAETFEVSNNTLADPFDAEGANLAFACTPVLPDNEPDITFIEAIEHNNTGGEDAISEIDVAPGDTGVFYARVSYDGRTHYSQQGGNCDVESYDVAVNVTLPGVRTAVLDATTRIFAQNPYEDPWTDDSRARLALEDKTLEDGVLSKLPRLNGISPGQTETIPFTLSLQTGHEDQVRVTAEPRSLIDDLVDEGWTVRLVSLSSSFERVSNREIVVPGNDVFGHDDQDALGHASGVDYQLGLEVEAPTSGITENERHTFSIIASSLFTEETTIEETDSIGVGIQVGEDFAFELSPSRDTIQAHPGDTVAFGLAVNNTGASRDTYRITATAPSAYGTPLVRPSTLDVSPATSKSTSIEVDVPDTASPGSSATINVAVESENVDEEPQTQQFTVEVEPEGTLSLTANRSTVRVGPGGSTSIDFTVENSQDTSRTIRVRELFAPRGWQTTFGNQTQGDTITVPAEGSTPFTYVISRAPNDILEGSRYTFVIRAEDASDPSDFANGVAHAVVQGQTAVELRPEESTKVVKRGASNTFNMTVHNIGTSPTWFELIPQFDSPGWSANVLEADGTVVDNRTVRVAEQLFKRVQIEVAAPEDVAKGHVEPVTLLAQAIGQETARDSITLDAQIHDFDVGISVTGPVAKAAAPGDDVEYTLNVTNLGNGPDRIHLSFEDLEGTSSVYPASTELEGDTTPVLDPGETLSGVRAHLHVPSPNQGPIPTPDGVTTIVRANSTGADGDAPPTTTTEVVTRLVNYKRLDVDGDGADEVALDLNRDPSDGFEVFKDQDANMIERGELSSDASIQSEGLYSIDADDDGRREHIIDTNGNGLGDIYYDPDRAQTFPVPYTIDANQDSQPEHPLDTGFDGLIDQVQDPAAEGVHKAENLDFSGDGQRGLLIDVDDDTFFDTYVNPHTTPHTVTGVDRDGSVYKIDTDGDGKIDTHYDASTQSISGAASSNLSDFLSDYWWFIVVFVVVIGLFGVIVVRRL